MCEQRCLGASARCPSHFFVTANHILQWFASSMETHTHHRALVWTMVLEWLGLLELLRMRPLGRTLERELARRSVLLRTHTSGAGGLPGWATPPQTFYYWRGRFAGLRGRLCRVLWARDWNCPFCGGYRGRELEVQPVFLRAASRSRSHLHLIDGGSDRCRCRPEAKVSRSLGDLLSVRR